MGLVIKKQNGSTQPEKADDKTQKAITRLKSAKPVKSEGESKNKPKFHSKDADKTALGKTRCVQFQAALESPAIAGMQFNTMAEYLELVTQAAEAGVAYSVKD